MSQDNIWKRGEKAINQDSPTFSDFQSYTQVAEVVTEVVAEVVGWFMLKSKIVRLYDSLSLPKC